MEDAVDPDQIAYRKRRVLIPIVIFSVVTLAFLWALARATQAMRNQIAIYDFGGPRGMVAWEYESLWYGVPDQKPRTPKFMRSLFWDAPVLDDIHAIMVDSPKPIEPEDFESLTDLPKLRYLSVTESGVGDEHLKFLKSRFRLQDLELRCPSVTDEGVRHVIQECPNLEFLSLRQSSISGGILGEIASMRKLEELNLAETMIQNGDLVALENMPKLKFLGLSKHITDAGLESIIRIPTLESLEFHGSPITDEGVDLLVERLPNLEHLILTQTYVNTSKMAELEGQGITLEATW